jgi:hypothetical protein
MMQVEHTLTDLPLPKQLQKLVKNAEMIQSEPFQVFKDKLSRKLLWLRPSVNGISAISFCEDTPQLGFSNISICDHEKIMEKQLPPPGRETPEKHLQSWLIQSALKSGGRLKLLDDILGGQHWFVSDEIALKTASEKVVADLLLVRIDSHGLASLVNAELKSERLMETFRQVICFRAALEDPGLHEGWKTFAEVMTGKNFRWHPSKQTYGVVIWPAFDKDPMRARANAKRKDYERVEVIGYRCDPAINEYTLYFERVRLKKGTVIGESQDKNGQWWRTTVVKDTGTDFKSMSHKIDAPNREAPRSATQSDARR